MNDIKFGNIEALQRDLKIEGETGTEVGLENGATLICLAATDANPRWREIAGKVRAEINRLSNARAPNDRVRRYLANAYSRAIVIGWRGVKDSDGNEVPFSQAACEQFLNVAFDAYTAVDNVVYDSKNFRGARIEAIVGQVGES
jgi:hypothetical protein